MARNLKLLSEALEQAFKEIKEDTPDEIENALKDMENMSNIVKRYIKEVLNNKKNLKLLDASLGDLQEFKKKIDKINTEERTLFINFLKSVLAVALILKGLEKKFNIQNVDNIIGNLGVSDAQKLKGGIEDIKRTLGKAAIEIIEYRNKEHIAFKYENDQSANNAKGQFNGVGLNVIVYGSYVIIESSIENINSTLKGIGNTLNNIKENLTEQLLSDNEKSYLDAATSLLGSKLEGLETYQRVISEVIDRALTFVRKALERLEFLKKQEYYEKIIEQNIIKALEGSVNKILSFDDLVDIFTLIWTAYIGVTFDSILDIMDPEKLTIHQKGRNIAKQVICEGMKKLLTEERWNLKTKLIGEIKGLTDLSGNLQRAKERDALEAIRRLLNKVDDKLKDICSGTSSTP